MKSLNRFQQLLSNNNKGLAVLIDPDKIQDVSEIEDLIQLSNSLKVDFLFFGGSTVIHHRYKNLIEDLKAKSKIPLILFPGNYKQLHPAFDAVLFLSLISGRNPEYLIGQHVLASKELKESGVETIPTGYMLVGDDINTSVAYVSNTTPIPNNQVNIATSTAIAGELLGHKCIYLDAGSGAENHVSVDVIKDIRENINLPLIVGGGIGDPLQAYDIYKSGADTIVIGNLLEKDPYKLDELIGVRNSFLEKSKIHQ